MPIQLPARSISATVNEPNHQPCQGDQRMKAKKAGTDGSTKMRTAVAKLMQSA